MSGRIIGWLRNLLTRREVEHEVDEELLFHVEMETRENLDRGMTPAEARRCALRDLGGVDQTRESIRDQRATWLDAVVHDLSHAGRWFRRDLAVTASTVLTIGLAVGLATTVYSVAAAVLLRPLPYHQPDRLLSVWRTLEDVDFAPLAVADLYELRERTTTLASVAGLVRDGFVVTTAGVTQWADAFRVTPNLFDLLGVRAVLGRTFRPDEEQPGHDHVVVLTEAFWHRALGADRGIVGRRLWLKAEDTGDAPPEAYEIVGVVAPELEFFYPKSLKADLFLPRTIRPSDRTDEGRSSPTFFTIVRATPSATLAGAVAEITRVLLSNSRAHPGLPFSNTGVRVAPLHEELVGRTRPVFLVLAAAALVLLAIGSINVGNLLLAAGLRRAPEMATRLALGCSRWRLCRQLLLEHLVMTGAGGAWGVVLALWLTPVLVRLAPVSIPRIESATVDVTALVVAIAATGFVAVVVAIVPALLASRPRGAWDHLRPTLTATGRRWLVKDVLVALEATLMLALLGVASLVGQSTWRLNQAPRGFDPSGVLAGALVMPDRPGGPGSRVALERRVLETIRVVPGVQAASIGSELPFTWGLLDAMTGRDHVTHRCVVSEVDETYLSLLRMPLRQGRPLTAADVGDRHVVLVNETLARRLGPSNVLGQHVQVDDEWRQIVGVVGDVTEVGAVTGRVIRRPGLQRLTLPAAYLPLGTADPVRSYLLVRTTLTRAEALAAVGRRLRALDPQLALRQPASLEERVAAAGAETRWCALVVALFTGVALALAVLGLYGLLAHTVGQRTREIGIRIAIGATPRRVRWDITGRVYGLVGIGTLAGAGLWWVSGRAVRQFLFEVAPTDPWTLGASIAALALATVAAGWFPARQASRLDPTVTLRCE